MKSSARLFVIVSLAAIAGAATLVYVTTWSDAFIADDWTHLLHSKNLTFSTFAGNCSFTHEDNYYRPVAIGYYYLNYAVWGLEPTGYHAVKALFFAATAALLFIFVLRATGQRIAALAAGLVFALHPMNTTCAAWLATHGNVLCAFFYLLALVLFVEVRKRERFNFFLYAGFLVSMLFCFGSYELGYTLPGALILTEILLLWRKTGESAGSYLKKALRAHAPYLVVAGAFFVLRFVYMGVENPKSELTALPVVMAAFMPVGVLDSGIANWVRLAPTVAGLAFFAAALVFGRGLRRVAIFGAMLAVVGAIPVLGAIDSTPAFGHIRFLIISMTGFGVLIGSCVSMLWRWRAGKVAGAIFLAALLGVYLWLDLGWREKWSLTAAQSEAVVETVTERCRDASPPFRLVFLTYPEVKGVATTGPHFVMTALLAKDVIRVERQFLHDSPYFKAFYDVALLTPEARRELVRWLPVRYGGLELYNDGILKESEKVYEIPREDLDRTFFFYWEEERQRLFDCTDGMRERLGKERDKTLFAWSVSERIPSERISFPSFEGRHAPDEKAMYLSPIRGGAVPPVIAISLENTTCGDFDAVEMDLTAASKSFRKGYFTGYATFSLEGEGKSLGELAERKVGFVGAYYEFHEGHHLYWIPLAQRFTAYDGKRVATLYIVLPPEVKEYALRGIRLRRFDE